MTPSERFVDDLRVLMRKHQATLLWHNANGAVAFRLADPSNFPSRHGAYIRINGEILDELNKDTP